MFALAKEHRSLESPSAFGESSRTHSEADGWPPSESDAQDAESIEEADAVVDADVDADGEAYGRYVRTYKQIELELLHRRPRRRRPTRPPTHSASATTRSEHREGQVLYSPFQHTNTYCEHRLNTGAHKWHVT